MKHFIILLLLGAGLWACSDVYTITAVSDTVEVNDSVNSNKYVDSLIAPYRKSLSEEMDVVIGYSKHDMTKGRPNASLNNWAVDAMVDYEKLLKGSAIENYPPIIGLLNVGGLRNPISQGDITTGDIFKLMPFDNEVVWVEMPWESLVDIQDYLITKGGEPISGATLIQDSLILDQVSEPTESFWVITSDYLMNGGDHMDFFDKQLQHQYGSGLLRDAFIESVRIQDTLNYNTTERIQL
ncbi:MAG: 5'-nucleotidase [Crocinitomicaceae bacterium]